MNVRRWPHWIALLLLTTAPSCGQRTDRVVARSTLVSPAMPLARELRWSDLDVHAATSVFSGTALPKVLTVWRGDPRVAVEPFTVSTTYYDADYNPVTKADKPGRYGAIVEVTTNGGRTLRRFLTLYRTPARVDWDYVRTPMDLKLPPAFGVSPDALARQRDLVNDLLKYQLQHSAEHASDLAMMLAGLHEANVEGDPFVARNGFEAVDQRWWLGLKRKTGTLGLPYLIHLPTNYDADPSAKHPLILFLHGSGEAGDGGPDLAKVEKNGLSHMAKTGDGLPTNFPFIVVSPQCPPDKDWSPYELDALLDEIEQTYRVDVDREYCTGLSLGGYGTWDTAIAFPHRFAAIAPVAGAGDANDVGRIKDLPAWVFHGRKDGTVPVEEAYRMVDALEKIGGRVKLTIYPNAGHNSWTAAYHTPELYDWFLHQRRGSPQQPRATTQP